MNLFITYYWLTNLLLYVIINISVYYDWNSYMIETFEEFEKADEIFLSGNMAKITPVTKFNSKTYSIGPITKTAQSLYWDWANSTKL